MARLARLARPVRAITVVRDPVDRTLSWWYRLLSKLDSPADADLWRERLRAVVSRHYVVGLHEAYPESVERFAAELGWSERDLPLTKQNRRRPRTLTLLREEAELVRAANSLDVELHEYARQALALDRAPPARAGRRPSRGYEVVERHRDPDPARAEELAWRRQVHSELSAMRVELERLEREVKDQARTQEKHLRTLGARLKLIDKRMRRAGSDLQPTDEPDETTGDEPDCPPLMRRAWRRVRVRAGAVSSSDG